MAKSHMVNFRAPEEMLEMYDEAAEAAGMTRSQWLRNAADLALGRHRDSGITPKAGNVQPSTGPKCVKGNYRTCDVADWRKLPTGLKACQTCGVRTSG